MPGPPPSPTSFTITPTTSNAHPGALSGQFTLTLNTASVAGDSFTLSDGGHGGTFYPGVAVTIPTGQTSATFSYLQPVVGDYTITATHGTLGAHSATIAVLKELPGWELRLYDANDKRKILPAGCITSVDFEVLERGGYGRGSFEAATTWEELPLAGTERVDVLFNNKIVYRGLLRIPERHADGSGEKATPTLYGRMEQLNGYHVNRQYSYGSPRDIADLFHDLMTDYVAVSGRLPGVVIDRQLVGVHVQQFDAKGKGVREALNQLCDIAPGQCIWGFDTVLSGAAYVDRVYFRPMPTAVVYTFSLRGGEAGSLQYSEDTSAIVNRLFIKGGKVAQPNVLKNGSFEEPLPNSETIGNMLVDYSVESGNPAWTCTGTVHGTGGGDPAGGPRTGSTWIELDNPGELITQDVIIDYHVPLTGSVWARRETFNQPNAVRVQVLGLNGGGGTVATFTNSGGFSDPGGILYRRYTCDADFSAYPTVVKARYIVECSGGSASDDGINADDFALYETNGVANSGWKYTLYGSAKRQQLNWQCRSMETGSTTPYHGGYCTQVQAGNIGAGTDYLEIRTHQDARAAIKPGQVYTLILFMRNDATGSPMDFTFGLTEFKGDNTVAHETESAACTDDTLFWKPYILRVTTNAAATAVEVFIRFRNGNTHYLDAIGLFEGDVPAEINSVAYTPGGYWSGDTYERVIDVADSGLSDGIPMLSTEAYNSITTYGEREAEISNSAIVDYATAAAFARGYFNSHAVPRIQGPLTIHDPRTLVKPDGTVRLLNLPNPPPAEFPSRIHTRFNADGFVTQEIELGNERPELADLLKLTEQRARQGLAQI
jgi:hypothetical protein